MDYTDVQKLRKQAAKTDVNFWNNDVPVQVKGLGGTEYIEDTPDGYDFQLHPQGGDQLFRETYGKGKHWNSTQKGSAVSILLSGLLGAGVGAGALAGLGQLAKATGIENKDKSIMPLALAGGLFGGLYGSLGAGAAVANGKTRGRYEDALRTPKEQKKYNESSTLKEWLVPGEAARQNQRNGRYALWAESKHPYRYTVTGKDPGYTQDSLEEALKSKDYKTRHAAENFMENLAAVSMADDTEQRILAENLVNKYYGGDVDFRDPQNLYEYIHAQPYEMDDYNNEPLDKWKRIIIEKMFTGEPAAVKNRSLKMYRRYG